MKETLDAVYADGVFRPLRKPRVRNRQRVHLTVETTSSPRADEILALACSVYDGMGEEKIRQIEEVALDRTRFFGGRGD